MWHYIAGSALGNRHSPLARELVARIHIYKGACAIPTPVHTRYLRPSRSPVGTLACPSCRRSPQLRFGSEAFRPAESESASEAPPLLDRGLRSGPAPRPLDAANPSVWPPPSRQDHALLP